jgi:hypothetical protein
VNSPGSDEKLQGIKLENVVSSRKKVCYNQKNKKQEEIQ